MGILYNEILDSSCGQDAKIKRSILQNGADQSVVAVNQTVGVQYMFQNFLGFLSSVPTINTNLTGPINIRITLNDPSCLIQNATCAGANFTISNIFGSVDIISINDDYFNSSFDSLLGSGQCLEIPYSHFFSFTNPNCGLTQSTRFSLNTSSLDRLIASFIPGLNVSYKIASLNGTANSTPGSSFDPISKNSSAFTRIGGTGPTVTWGDATNNTQVTYPQAGSYFQINNSQYPTSWQPTPEQCFGIMLNACNISQTVDGGISPNINSLAAWTGSHFMQHLKLNHGESTSVISGVNTKGNSISLVWNSISGTQPANVVTGTGAASFPALLTAIVYAQCTSVLQIYQNQQCIVIT